MNKIIAAIYDKLVKNGRITEDMVPEEAKVILSSESKVVPEPVQEEPELLGALTIPSKRFKLDDIDIEAGPDGTIEENFVASVNFADVFTKEVLGDNPMPDNIKMEIIRIEPNAFEFYSGIDVGADFYTPEKWTFDCIGYDGAGLQIDTYFRADICVRSSNYEEMYFTAYFGK